MPLRVIEGVVADGNLQESKGPAGVLAVNSRNVAGRLSLTAVDDIRVLCRPGTLRCCNCGLVVTEDMKLPVRDPHDPIAPLRPGVESRDYVRIPLDYDELRNPTFEYTDYVACTPPCALRSMYDNPDLTRTHVPHIFAIMMAQRHRIDEPTNAAPPTDALAYLYKTSVSSAAIGLTASSFYWLLSHIVLIG
jgi:hypothetical protein